MLRIAGIITFLWRHENGRRIAPAAVFGNGTTQRPARR
ncbi:MAG: hypothetical protein AVDCRST_MAG62-643 [uncultured Sphingomonas sp.]|uniref:Uncharacterized protein n=1 Tax=uncultured Sphingomonas sp. TaxID=158754 RepID=A0A6J4T404_9SPHN|nr:MAG: hypothetical protein AVDCRST_MAG62-643 [uncultured Sphingomonas sp.]